MIKAAIIPLGLVLLVASAPFAQAQTNDQDTAISEAIYRQASRIDLRNKLIAAQEARDRGELATAAKLYGDAWELVQRVGAGVENEAQRVRAGLGAVRMELARKAQSRGDLREAQTQVADVLRVDPTNAEARQFSQANSRMLASRQGKIPSEEVASRVPAIIQEKIASGTLVQDGKLLVEMGKLDEAEAKLQRAITEDPLNDAAYYYLNIIRERRFKEALKKRDISSRESLVEVQEAWHTARPGELLQQPNPYARTNLVFTGKGRQAIISKLDRIRLDEIGPWDNLPLGEVLSILSEQSRRRDPENKGVNFLINPNAPAAPATPGLVAIDPTTGLPLPTQAPEPIDLTTVAVRINPALNDLKMMEALDAITMVADRPIKYSIEDYAVVFSMRGPETAPLHTRRFKVDPNTFLQGLESVTGFDFGSLAQSVSGGQGGQGGGGGFAGGGGIGGQGGQGGGGILTVPRVSVAGGSFGGGGIGGQGGGGQTGEGIRSVTVTNAMEGVQLAVRNFFVSVGVDLTPPKLLFFNDREGTLLVRATSDDLDIIEDAIQVLNIAPPQINIKAKFVEVAQNDSRAFGFDWYLGNLMMGNNVIGSAGTAPSFAGQPSTANPEGTFPGSAIAGTAIPQSASDGLVTGGLRNNLNAPALATITGVLTDPQFRVVMRALQQREGVDLLNEASINTLSGRQAQIQVVDLQTIVANNNVNQTGTGGGGAALGGVATGAGAVATAIIPSTTTVPIGPTLDVVPYVSADGFTVQMTIIPTVTEFLGYDDPGQFITQAQSVSGGAGGASQPLTAVLPLPRFRVRQVTTSAIVWDGQTVVLGGLVSENVSKYKDQVPILGDLPILGRFFRSESSETQKKNLIIFVTPTIIDPAGNRFHSDDELPFAQNAIPLQRPIIPVGQ